MAVATDAAANTLTWKGGFGPNWSTPENWVENMAPTGRVTFLPGETAKSLDIRIFGDTMAEQDETFAIVLADASGAASAGWGTVVVANDDRCRHEGAPQDTDGRSVN